MSDESSLLTIGIITHEVRRLLGDLHPIEVGFASLDGERKVLSIDWPDRGVSLYLRDAELALSLDDFISRFLVPALQRFTEVQQA